MTKVERQTFWETTIAEFKASGQSVLTWCADQNLRPHQLWYWLRKEKQTSSENALSWLPLDLSDAGLQSSILVRVGRVAVEVRPGFDPKLLLDVVKTLISQ